MLYADVYRTPPPKEYIIENILLHAYVFRIKLRNLCQIESTMPRGYKYEIDIDDDNNNSVNYTVVIVRIITIIAIIQA